MRRSSMIIILDTLESYNLNLDGFKEALRGLITAVLTINREMKSNKIHVFLFLPAEIYSELASEMPAKIADKSVFLQWNRTDLFLMIALRFLELIHKTKALPSHEILHLESLLNPAIKKLSKRDEAKEILSQFWHDTGFLPKVISNRLGYNEDCLNYILRHTQRRPRELILVFNSIIELAENRNEFPKISSNTVVDGIHNRKTLYTLISDTLSPFNGYIDRLVDRTGSVFQSRDRVMSGSELKKFAGALFDVGPLPGMDEEDFLNFMLRGGVVGRIKNQDRKEDPETGYCLTEFEYLMQGRITWNNRLDYYVHPILGDFLEMPSVPGYGMVYPVAEDEPD